MTTSAPNTNTNINTNTNTHTEPTPEPTPRLVLVTGATDGIGKHTALHIAQAGHHVVIHGRNPERLTEVRSWIEEKTGNRNIHTIRGDLSSFDSIKKMASDVADRYEKLDVLINNAGVYMNDKALSADGIEMTFAVNHVAPFLLTHLLLPQLANAPAGRVVNVSSVAHTRGAIDFEQIANPKRFDSYGAYAASKLANLLFNLELHQRLRAHPDAAYQRITCNALHPGVVSTKLLVDGFGMQGPDSLDKGSATSVFLALDPSVDGVSDQYFYNLRATPPSTSARNEKTAKRLYEMSASLTSTTPLTR